MNTKQGLSRGACGRSRGLAGLAYHGGDKGVYWCTLSPEFRPGTVMMPLPEAAIGCLVSVLDPCTASLGHEDACLK